METIKIHRNNSGVAKITLKSKSDGTAWNIPIGNELQFTVKKSVTDTDEEIIFFKTGTGDGGNVYNFFITGFDTDIMPGIYKWDLKDKTANLTLDMGDFKILEDVYQGQAVTGEENELTEIECLVEVSGFQYVSDYDLLYNKPQINSVELSGNKTGSDLGLADLTVTDGLDERLTEAEEDINVLNVEMDTKADKTELPEKLSDLTNDSGFIAESVIDSKDTATLNTAKAYTDAEIADLNIPAKTSDLTNDSGFITSAYHDSTKLDKQTTTTGNYAYTYNASGSSSTHIVNDNTTAGTIAQRAADGSVYAETPATGNNKQVINRGFLTTQLSGKVDTTTFETAINNVYTKAETNSAIASAVEGIVSFDCKIVETLPASGVKGTIYLTEKTTTETGDIYNEYLWIVPESGTGIWEKIGNTAVDISGKLDKVTASHAYSRVYAVNQAGEQTLINAVAKSTNAGTVPLTTTGGRIRTPEPINSDELTTKNYVDTHLSAKLDKPATPTEKAVVTIDTDGTGGTVAESEFVKFNDISTGLRITTNTKKITTDVASQRDIDIRNGHYRVITPENIEYAVKVNVTTNTIRLTDAEKQSASAWILPAFTEEDEGKVLGIANGALAWTYFADLDDIEYPQENE